MVRVWFCSISNVKKRNFQGQRCDVAAVVVVVAVVAVGADVVVVAVGADVVVVADVVLLVLSAKDDDAGKL